jgi:single-strand DNA-binding protein
MNKVILMGRLTKDPETRQAGDTIVTRFSIAVDRRYKQDGGQAADFPSCVAFGKTAEFINKYFHKGMKILLEGRLQTGDYTDKNGVKHYTTDVIADSVEFAESKKADNTQQDADGWAEITDDNLQLPFN